MDFNFNFEEKKELEVLLLAINIGLMDLLHNHLVDINEVEQIFYSPRMAKYLNKIGVAPKIINLVDSGCEIEDIESLMPHKLDSYITTLKNDSYKLINELYNNSKK